MKNLSIQKNKNYNFGGEASKKGIFFALSVFIFIFSFSLASAATVKSIGNSGLVGYWSFNDGVGAKANDMSGNKNVGTLNGGATWVSGRTKTALNFNGSTGYVTSPTNLGLSGDFSGTISAWVKRTSGSTFQTVYVAGSAVSMQSFGLGINTNSDGDINIQFNGGNARYSAGGLVPLNRWTHLVVTKTPGPIESTSHLYINGIEVSQIGGQTGTPNFVSNLSIIGRWTTAPYFFNGSVDDVRVYNRALSASEIKTLYQFGTAQIKSVQKSGLVGYWPMNEGVGSKVNDMSGNKNIGTLAGATLPSWINGRLGKALFFDGVTSKVSLGSLNISTDVTISAWVRMSTSGEVPVLSNRSGGSGVVYFGAVGGKLFVYDNGATPAAGMTSNASINTNTWKHVVWTSDGTTSNMYINGVFDKTQAHARTGGVANGNIGWDLANNVEYFPGYIDDVRVYNRALSGTEIQQLYKQNATQVNASTNNFLNSGLIYVFSLNGGDISWGSNTAYDRSGQGNNATLVSFSTTSSPATGKLGQGLKFNGVSTYLNTPAMAFLGQASATFSVSVWVKPRVVGGTIIHNMNESVGWSTGLIGFRGGKLSYNIYANGFADSPNTAVAGRWLLVSFTRDGVTGVNKLYENGVLVKTTTTGYSPSGGSHKFTLGRFVADCCQMDSPGWFDGVMDDYRLYNRVLSEAEIKQLYNMAR